MQARESIGQGLKHASRAAAGLASYLSADYGPDTLAIVAILGTGIALVSTIGIALIVIAVLAIVLPLASNEYKTLVHIRSIRHDAEAIELADKLDMSVHTNGAIYRPASNAPNPATPLELIRH